MKHLSSGLPKGIHSFSSIFFFIPAQWDAIVLPASVCQDGSDTGFDLKFILMSDPLKLPTAFEPGSLSCKSTSLHLNRHKLEFEKYSH